MGKKMRRYRLLQGQHQDEGGWTYRAGEKDNDIIETDNPLVEMFGAKFEDLGPVFEDEDEPTPTRRRRRPPAPEATEDTTEDGEEGSEEAAEETEGADSKPVEADETSEEVEKTSLEENEDVRAVHKGGGRWEVELIVDGVATGRTVNEKFLKKDEARALVDILRATKEG